MAEEKGFYTRFNGEEYRRNAFQTDPTILPANKKTVVEFVTSWASRKDTSTKRVAKMYANFRMLLKLADKKFNIAKASLKDLEEMVSAINKSQYSDATKSDLRRMLKSYYSFYNNGEAPEKSKWIPTANPKPRHRTAEELISREERDKLIQACVNERDRAFIMLLHEGGLRAGEMSALRINSISYSNDGMWVDIPEVKGLTKTGGRKILVIESEPYMKNWLRTHPGKRDKESPLWVKLEKYGDTVEPMPYDNMRMMVLRKAESAEINPDKCNLHNFRHSSASEKAAAGWNKPLLDSFFGWEPTSNTAATYSHIQERDMVAVMRRMHGLPVDSDAKKKEKVSCPRCGELNDASAEECRRCGISLSLKAAVQKTAAAKEQNTLMLNLMEQVVNALEINNRYHDHWEKTYPITVKAVGKEVEVLHHDLQPTLIATVKRLKDGIKTIKSMENG